MSTNVITSTDSDETPRANSGEVSEGSSDEKNSASAKQPDETTDESETSETDEESRGDQDGKDAEDADRPKKRNGVQKRIDKLSKKLTDREQRLADRERELEYWKTEALKKNQSAEPEARSKAHNSAEKPKPEDFETHEDWLDARDEWNESRREKVREAKEREKSVQSEHDARVQSHVARVNAFAEKYPDFHDVMADVDDVPLSVTVRQCILKSENGPELMYELAKNPEEFERICKLDAIDAAVEIGLIQAKLRSSAKEPAKTKSSAPAPLTPVGTKSTASRKSIYDKDISFSDYERLRREQLKAKG